jgi:hypothetical protein
MRCRFMSRSKQYSHWIPDRQMDAFRDLQLQTGVTVSETMRRMYDFCFSEPVMNQLFPSMSGQIRLGVK